MKMIGKAVVLSSMVLLGTNVIAQDIELVEFSANTAAKADEVNSNFSALKAQIDARTPLAWGYLWSGSAAGGLSSTDPIVVPPGTYAFNSTGGQMIFERRSVGNYAITFEDQPNSNGIGYASADVYGSTAGSKCNVRNWARQQINVICVDAANSPVDVNFTVEYKTGNVVQ